MKAIFYRGGVVTFRIPADWTEEYSDIDGGMFYEDHPESGTLRLKVITLSSPRELTPDSAMQVMQMVCSPKTVGTEPLPLHGGNAMLRYEQSTSEQGKKLTIFYWIIIDPVPPLHARVVTFSYTVLEEQRETSQVLRDLQMLEREIAAAEFSRELGIVSE